MVKSTVRRKILGLFAINPNQELYAGQVAKEIDEAPHAVGLELAYLTKSKFLKKVEKNQHVFYQWNETNPYAILLKKTINRMREDGNKEMLALRDIQYHQELQRNLNQVLEDLKKYYDPEKVILFGSMASGKIGLYSDIDLVVIKQTTLPYFKRIRQLVDLLDYNVGIDFFVYTPEEFAESVQIKRFFREEILKKGKILYEKTS